MGVELAQQVRAAALTMLCMCGPCISASRHNQSLNRSVRCLCAVVARLLRTGVSSRRRIILCQSHQLLLRGRHNGLSDLDRFLNLDAATCQTISRKCMYVSIPFLSFFRLEVTLPVIKIWNNNQGGLRYRRRRKGVKFTEQSSLGAPPQLNLMLIQQNKFYWISDRSEVAHLN